MAYTPVVLFVETRQFTARVVVEEEYP